MPSSNNLKSTSSSGDAQQQTRKSSTAKSTARGFPLAKSTVAVGALASLVAYFIWQGPADVTPPGAYAVCSSDGNKIYTVDQHNARVACFVVAGKRVHDVGSLAGIRWRWYSSFVTTNRLQGPFQWHLPVRYVPKGSVVVPGISDSHAHILEYGGTQQLQLEGTKTVEETVARVRNFVLENLDIFEDETRLITGGGWDHTSWPKGAFPSWDALNKDPVLAGRRIILQSKDCHALWVSSAALEPSLPLPEEVEGGVILRDSEHKPTGVLIDNAQSLLKQPPLTHDDLLRRFKVTVREAHKYGLTSIHDAGLDPMSLEFFQREAEKAPLPIRIYGMKFFNETIGYSPDIRPIEMPDRRLSVRSIKIFADGALRTAGAALYEPYADAPETSGFMRLDPEILYDNIPKFLSNGWQVNVHAIGDRANGIVLDVFESSLKGVNVTALRPRLEHAQMMTKEDMARLGKLGVIVSVQPTHAISDMWYAQDRLGLERVKLLYAFRSIIDNGARITLGSDAPVETLNPIAGFYSAITRLAFDGTSPHGPGGWFPEERLTRDEALRGITIDPAYASFTEAELGSLEIGKMADFVVLSQDIMTVPISEIMSTNVLATTIDGEVVYGKI